MEKVKYRLLSPTCIALCVYFIMLPFDFLSIGSIGSITKILAILPMAVAVLENVGNHKFTIRLSPIVKWIFLYLLLAAASYIYSVSRELSSASIKTLALNSLMVIIMGSAISFDDNEIAALKRSLIIGSWISVVMVLFFGTANYGRTTIIINGTQQDQNYLCGYMIFAFVSHFSLFLEKRKIGHLTLSFLILMAVILTGSRGALLAFFVGILCCVLTASKENGYRTRVIISSVLGILAIFFALYYFVLPRLNSVLYSRFTLAYLMENGTVGRSQIWLYLLDKFKSADIFRQLFGNGYGTTTFVNNVGGVNSGKVAHNLYLDSLTTLGIIGLVGIAGQHISCLLVCKRLNEKYYLCIFIAFIAMCMSMSLVSYKPMWSTMIMILAIYNKRQLTGES